MAVKYIVIWGFVSIAASLISGAVAALKNRNVSYWMGWSFVLPPMLVALLLIPTLKEPAPRQPSNDDDDSA
jgi:hypothetical protein